MAESVVRKLQVIYPKLGTVETLSRTWSISKCRELVVEMSAVIEDLRAKKHHDVRVSFRHCVATLNGVIKGREEKAIEKDEVKKHLRKLLPVIATLREQIEELDILTDSGTETPVKKTITIRTRIDEI